MLDRIENKKNRNNIRKHIRKQINFSLFNFFFTHVLTLYIRGDEPAAMWLHVAI